MKTSRICDNTNILKYWNLKTVDRLVADGLLNRQVSPNGLILLDYTKKAQYDDIWNEYTLQSRGIILNPDGTVHTRTYPKFFNYEEHMIIPAEWEYLQKIKSFRVFDKLDGSFGSLYWENGAPKIATRGSFKSEQAIEGTEILWEKYSHLFTKLDRNLSYIFEIIYPANRICVSYGDLRDLILTGIIDTQTGETLDLSKFNPGFSVVTEFSGINDFSKIRELTQGPNREGCVILTDTGFRMKVKQHDYIELHRTVTRLDSRDIWEHLSSGKSMEILLETVPDELWDWIRKWDSTFKTGMMERMSEIDAFTIETNNKIAELESHGVVMNDKRVWDIIKGHPLRNQYLNAKKGLTQRTDKYLWDSVYPDRITYSQEAGLGTIGEFWKDKG